MDLNESKSSLNQLEICAALGCYVA